jgi:hypothetical protein
VSRAGNRKRAALAEKTGDRETLAPFSVPTFMAERKGFRMRVARLSNRAAGKRETFKIAVSVPRYEHGTERDPAAQALDNATKIFENLVQSGRLPKSKK